MLGDCFKSKNNPSAIALSRQKLPYISEHNSGENKCSKGGYILKNSAGSNREADPVDRFWI